MPDRRTVYITDDGPQDMFTVYTMSRAGDLSCGKIYAAKFHQKSAAYGTCPNFCSVCVCYVYVGFCAPRDARRVLVAYCSGRAPAQALRALG
jgi:hypothetical protein